MSDIEQRIRQRAFQFWEQAGRPHGRGDEFWFAARQELEGDVPPVGDQPGGAIDYPPDERSLEDVPDMAVMSGDILQPHSPEEPVPAAAAASPAARPVAAKAARIRPAASRPSPKPRRR